jgi:hypothetical protein
VYELVSLADYKGLEIRFGDSLNELNIGSLRYLERRGLYIDRAGDL